LKCDFGGQTIEDTSSIADSKWNHIAVVYDKPNRKLAFYRNWSKIGEKTVTESSIKGATVKPITIAGCTPSGTTYTGLMDEIRITKRALAAREFLRPDRPKGLTIMVH
jgi:hypothetical protein